MAALATVVDVPLRCTPQTLSLILDTDHRVIAAVGGARSMKTQTGVVWAFRQWMLRGGQAVIAWFLGPELDRAFVLVEKWCDGEDENPPVCPPSLIRSRPASKRDLDPAIEMIDGTRIMIKHTGTKGKNLTARGVPFWLWTEAATTSSPMNFVRLRGRTVQSCGQGYMDAVPEDDSWVKPWVIDAALAESEERADALAAGLPANDSTYRVIQLSQLGNPWVRLEEGEAFRRDLRRGDPRIASREGDGEWVGDKEALYAFDESRISFDPGDLSVLDFLGFEDATEQASLRWFVRPHAWIIAGDINARPHTSLMGKIAVPRGADARNPNNWHAVFLDHLQVFGLDSEQAALELKAYRDGLYAKAGFIIDATSTLERHNAGGVMNSRKGIKPREAFEAAGFEVRGPAPQVHEPWRFRNPEQIDSVLVTRRILRENRVHIDRRTCRPFITALRVQKAEADGVTPQKKSNTNQDRYIAAFTDCFRYWTYPFFDTKPHELPGSKPIGIIEYG